MLNNYSMKGGLRREALAVATASPEVSRNVGYDLTILADGKDIKIRVVESVSIVRDFNSKITDSIKIVFNIPAGVYIEDVKPFKNNLKAKLKHTTPGLTSIDEYKLIIALEDKNIAADSIKGKKSSLDNGMLTIHAECVDESVLFLKQQNKGITIKDGTVGSAMIAALDAALVKVTSKFGIRKDPIHMVPPDNERVYKYVVIPATMKTLDVGIYLQEKLGGVYNGSINNYFYRENNTLKSFIFPLYRSNLLKSTGRKLIIISASDITTGAINTTYSVDANDDLRILVMQKEKLDDDNIEMLGKGGAIKGIDANTVRGRPVTISQSGVELKKKSMYRNMKENLADDLSDIINIEPTDNFYEPRSKILKNKLAKVTVEWNHSNFRLVHPYMPVIFLEETNGKVVMREGMVNGLNSMTIVGGKQETTVLSILITKRENSANKPVRLF